jgi:hypothetical protein
LSTTAGCFREKYTVPPVERLRWRGAFFTAQARALLICAALVQVEVALRAANALGPARSLAEEFDERSGGRFGGDAASLIDAADRCRSPSADQVLPSADRRLRHSHSEGLKPRDGRNGRPGHRGAVASVATGIQSPGVRRCAP